MQRRSQTVLVWCLALVLAWTPTGASAADPPVVLVAETAAGIVQMNPSTGAVERLLIRGGHAPAVSPDGRRLVFALRDEGAQHLWVSDLAGTNRRQLTTGNAIDMTPDWSPDGAWIALCRTTTDALGWHVRIAVVASTGGSGHTVAGTDGGCAPSWSPDSGLLVYRAADGIRVTDPDGRSNDFIAKLGTNPDWSPDGRTLAVTDIGSESDLSLVDVRTGEARTISEFEGYHVTWDQPVWSPDGSSLYTSEFTEGFPDENNHVPTGTALEHRNLDGKVTFWHEGTVSPGIGGGPQPPRDPTPPAPVAATATAVISGVDVDVSQQVEPDAAGVMVRYAAGEQAPATPHDGMPGGRSVRGHIALRHLAAETAYAISVFPLDWSGNVGTPTTVTARTPHAVGTALRISAPQFVTYGQGLALSGVLTRADTGGPIAGAQLELRGHLRGRPDALLATLTTDGNGVVSSRRLPSGETAYSLRYAGADPLQPASAAVTTQVRTAVSTQLSLPSVPRGGRAYVTVRLRPGLAGAKVYVLQRINGNLRNRWTALTGSSGVATVALDTRIRGRYEVTAVTYGDGLRIYGSSPLRTFAVT